MRHGLSCANVLKLFGHPFQRSSKEPDSPLSLMGEKQAEQAGKCLKDNKVKIDIVCCSTLRRAIQTAYFFAKGYGYEGKIYVLPFVSEERRFGFDDDNVSFIEKMKTTNHLDTSIRKILDFRFLIPMLKAHGNKVFSPNQALFDKYIKPHLIVRSSLIASHHGTIKTMTALKKGGLSTLSLLPCYRDKSDIEKYPIKKKVAITNTAIILEPFMTYSYLNYGIRLYQIYDPFYVEINGMKVLTSAARDLPKKNMIIREYAKKCSAYTQSIVPTQSIGSVPVQKVQERPCESVTREEQCGSLYTHCYWREGLGCMRDSTYRSPKMRSRSRSIGNTKKRVPLYSKKMAKTGIRRTLRKHKKGIKFLK